MNYFELFDLAPAPVVDKKLLTEKYFALQKRSHPDFFTQGTETEQADALEQSADVNKAFTTFQNEDKTLEYFLQIKGVIETDEKYQLAPAFLMEMMDINERLDETDSVTVTQELAPIEKALAEEVKPILDNPALHEDEASLEALKAYYYKKKYIQRILARLGD